MAKYLLLMLVVCIVYFLVKKRSPRDKVGEKKRVENEDMIPCRHCGTHLPRSESVCHKGDYYCSEEHLIASLDDQ